MIFPVRPEDEVTLALSCVLGNATLNAGAEPFAIPVGDTCLGVLEPRCWSVLLDAICSSEKVPGSERSTSNEWVPGQAGLV